MASVFWLSNWFRSNVWEADKLERAIEALEQTDPGPRTRLINEDGNWIARFRARETIRTSSVAPTGR
jgi:hypothetical protein